MSTSSDTVRISLKNQNNEKSYKCDQCDFASPQVGNLKRHKKIHSGEKPYHCHQCNFAAIRSGDLKRHLKIHSGENHMNATNVKKHMLRQVI